MTSGPMSEQVRRLVTEPGKELSRLAAFLRVQARLWRFCARRLGENNLTAMSAALSFRTIFALVPTLVLALLAARALGALEDSKASLRRFLRDSGLAQIAAPEEPADAAPPAADATPPARKVINVADQIESLVIQVESKLNFRRIGPVGAALFIWSALSLLTTIEHSLNRVFHAARSRSIARRVLLYWSVMTLGPVALSAAIYLGGRALRAFDDWTVLSWLFTTVGRIGPILVGILALSAVYILMPNTAVVRRAAFGGALVAVLFWLAAKWAFSLYVERFVVADNLYGILGVLPLFLLWLNLSWMIFLFGAELAHTAANLGQIWRAEESEAAFLSPSDALAVTLAVAGAFQSGEGPIRPDRIAKRVRLPDEEVQWLLERLAERQFVCPVNGETELCYVLARPPASLRVNEILEAGERREPQGKIAARAGDPAAIAADINSQMRSTISTLTVADVLAGATAPQGTSSSVE